MKNYSTIQEATFFAVKKTGALKVKRTFDGVNLEATGYDFFGNTCFNIYKSFNNKFNKIYIIRYTNN